MEDAKGEIERRREEVSSALAFIGDVTKGEEPTVLLGDFNATEDSQEIQMVLERGGFLDSFRVANPENPGYTWDTTGNPNTKHDAAPRPTGVVEKSPVELLEAKCDDTPRRIDYIFLSRHFAEGDILGSRVVLNRADEGVYPSDHFGVLTEIFFGSGASVSPSESR